MKTRTYTQFFVLTLIACIIFSSASFAQRGRYSYKYGHYSHYPAYRPYTTYSNVHTYAYVPIHYGGYDYRYNNGYFYRPYGSVFQVVAPPFGIRIATLPFGYNSFYIGPNPYYYFNGIYYRPNANQYEVVAPPLGAVVNKLPSGAKVKVIDGQKYYEQNNTFYKEEFNENNKLTYRVVGTDGVLNTDPNNSQTIINEPQVGDRIEKLPADSKSVVIRGEKLYSTPDGLYYKEIYEGNNVYYELVGM